MSHSWLSKLDQKSNHIVEQIGQLAQKLGVQAYLVGGPVRDLMLAEKNIDLDITVEGSGIRLAENFAKLHKTDQIIKYQAFKTATVFLSRNFAVDFATARKEIYPYPGAFPAVEPSDIKNDLLRRDFTVNAMAISINPQTWGKVLDPFKGRADLKLKRIRVLHAASFQDDPTRILRAARFKSRLGFSIEKKTLGLLKLSIVQGALQTIKEQRYKKEMQKILKEPKSKEMIQCLKIWNAYRENK